MTPSGRSGAGTVERLDLVFYWVSDLARAVGFYEAVLGAPPVRQDEGQWAEFDVAGRRFALHTAGDQPIQPGGAAAVFAVGDLEAGRQRLSGLGIECIHEGDVQGYARFASFLDPDGNTFQLIEYSEPQAESGPRRPGH